MKDADLLAAEFARLGNAVARARRAGSCTHGWLQGPPGRPVITCNDCGTEFPGMTLNEVCDLSRDLLNEWR